METLLLLLSILNLLLSAVVLFVLVSKGNKPSKPEPVQQKTGINGFPLGFARVLRKETPIDEFLAK